MVLHETRRIYFRISSGVGYASIIKSAPAVVVHDIRMRHARRTTPLKISAKDA